MQWLLFEISNYNIEKRSVNILGDTSRTLWLLSTDCSVTHELEIFFFETETTLEMVTGVGGCMHNLYLVHKEKVKFVLAPHSLLSPLAARSDGTLNNFRLNSSDIQHQN